METTIESKETIENLIKNLKKSDDVKVTQKRGDGYRIVIDGHRAKCTVNKNNLELVHEDGQEENFDITSQLTNLSKPSNGMPSKENSSPKITKLQHGFAEVNDVLVIIETGSVLEVKDQKDLESINDNIETNNCSYRMASKTEIEEYRKTSPAKTVAKAEKKTATKQPVPKPTKQPVVVADKKKMEQIEERMMKKYSIFKRKRMIIVYDSKEDDFFPFVFDKRKSFDDMNNGIKTMHVKRVEASLTATQFIVNKGDIFKAKKK